MPDGGESGAAMTAESQAEAVARNDALFRNANERINEVARSFDPDDEALLPFLCECADVRCTEVVQLSAREYEQLRRDPTRFATVPGHEGGDPRRGSSRRTTATQPWRSSARRPGCGRARPSCRRPLVNERKRRIGENEAIFRSVNEQVRGLTATLSTPGDTLRIVCECGARSCTDQFEIDLSAYAEIRADPTLFLVQTRARSPGDGDGRGEERRLLDGAQGRGHPGRDRPRDRPERLMRYLEPGRKRRRRRLSATPVLWVVAAAIALTLALQAIR